MYNFEECLQKNGFVADFSNTDDIVSLMNIDESENPDWYDGYYEALYDYAESKGLKKITWNPYNDDGSECGEYSDIFFAADVNIVIQYIKENYCTDNGETITDNYINRNLSVSHSFKSLVCQTGMTQKQFAEYFTIPLRTIEDWCREVSKPAPYLRALIEYKLKMENKI